MATAQLHVHMCTHNMQLEVKIIYKYMEGPSLLIIVQTSAVDTPVCCLGSLQHLQSLDGWLSRPSVLNVVHLDIRQSQLSRHNQHRLQVETMNQLSQMGLGDQSIQEIDGESRQLSLSCHDR